MSKHTTLKGILSALAKIAQTSNKNVTLTVSEGIKQAYAVFDFADESFAIADFTSFELEDLIAPLRAVGLYGFSSEPIDNDGYIQGALVFKFAYGKH